MGVTAEQLKGRVRALYPNANLSTVRISKIIERLGTKLTDDSTEVEADVLIKDFNDNGAMTFEEIAKNDDRLRTLEASKPTKVEPLKPDEPVKVDPDEPKWFTAYKLEQEAKIKALEQSNTGKTRKEVALAKFSKYPDEIKNDLISDVESMNFKDDEAFTSFLERKEGTYKGIAEKHKLEGFGNDAPAGSQGGSPKGTVKEKTAEETKSLADSI
jgi:hypothetical protein